AYRKLTLQYYPEHTLPIAFDRERYSRWCAQYSEQALRKGPAGYRKPVQEFPWEGGRAAQRALFYLLKDLLPIRYGLAPTIRFAEFELSAFGTGGALVTEARRRTLTREKTFAEPKTARSRRVIRLPASVVQALRAHRARQAEERLAAGARYENLDLVFATSEGRPLDERNLV